MQWNAKFHRSKWVFVYEFCKNYMQIAYLIQYIVPKHHLYVILYNSKSVKRETHR